MEVRSISHAANAPVEVSLQYPDAPPYGVSNRRGKAEIPCISFQYRGSRHGAGAKILLARLSPAALRDSLMFHALVPFSPFSLLRATKLDKCAKRGQGLHKQMEPYTRGTDN